MADNKQYKNSSQYKYYRHRFIYYLICAFAFIVINTVTSMILMISSNIGDDRLNNFFVVWIIVFPCMDIMFYTPFVIYHLIKIRRIANDVYKTRIATIVEINKITYYKIGLCLSLESSSELYDVVVYRRFSDEKQYRVVGSKINVLEGDNNILL